MIKLFRNLPAGEAGTRQKMLRQSRAGRYLLYAIGEIFLVVIGILIALQINNWNEENKLQKNAESALRALRSDLVKDTTLIKNRLPEVNHQYQLNESLRQRIANEKATVDTLINIARFEFNPNWNNPITYNTNAFNSMVTTGLIENISDSLRDNIKNYYNTKSNYLNSINNVSVDYSNKVSDYVNTYTFGSTELHDQGVLIDSLVWSKIDNAHLAASFQGLSNFKRIQFRLTKEEMLYSLNEAKNLINQIDQVLEKS